jgi:hypothetical protein
MWFYVQPVEKRNIIPCIVAYTKRQYARHIAGDVPIGIAVQVYLTANTKWR